MYYADFQKNAKEAARLNDQLGDREADGENSEASDEASRYKEYSWI